MLPADLAVVPLLLTVVLESVTHEDPTNDGEHQLGWTGEALAGLSREADRWEGKVAGDQSRNVVTGHKGSCA